MGTCRPHGRQACDAAPRNAAGSACRLRIASLRAAVAALGHELVELGLVLGLAQTIEEFLERRLFLLEPPERLLAILVKGRVPRDAPGSTRACPAAPTRAHL